MLRRLHTIFQAKPLTNASGKQMLEQSFARQFPFTLQDDKEKFHELTHEGIQPLYKIRTIFPLDFYPDTLIIDPLKITHIHKVFFWSEKIITILIKNIKFCILESGPFFSTLNIHDIMQEPTKMKIKPIWKKQAQKAHDLIQGLVVTAQQNVDTARIIPQNEIKQFRELGKPQE